MRVRVPSSPLTVAFAFAFALAACTPEPAPDASAPTAAQASAGSQTAAAPASAATPAVSPAQQQAWEAFLQRLDRDGDGVVARSEHTIATAVMFARMDRDGDEQVTVEEMDRERGDVLGAAPVDTSRRLAQVDDNQDGVLDEREHEVATRVVFDRYDRSGDGRLVREEFLAALAQQAAAGPSNTEGTASGR